MSHLCLDILPRAVGASKPVPLPPKEDLVAISNTCTCVSHTPGSHSLSLKYKFELQVWSDSGHGTSPARQSRMAPKWHRFLATFGKSSLSSDSLWVLSHQPMHWFVLIAGNGALGRLGTGPRLTSETFPRVLGSLVGFDIKHASAGGSHTAALTGMGRAGRGRKGDVQDVRLNLDG